MGFVVVERYFEMSVKVCFYVFFGDKLFIFLKLYFEWRVKEIV